MTDIPARRLRRPIPKHEPAHNGTGDVKAMDQDGVCSWSLSTQHSIEGAIR